MESHILRIFLAALGAFVAYMVTGGILFAAMPWLKNEFRKYPGVYRDEAGIKKAMPYGMLGMLVAMLALAVLYAHLPPLAPRLVQGATFGVLIGVYSLGSNVIHNQVNLNIGWALTIQSGIAYFIEWVAVGIAIGLIYRPG
jgi:hypothetical protein